jgi:hypothetical protein
MRLWSTDASPTASTATKPVTQSSKSIVIPKSNFVVGFADVAIAPMRSETKELSMLAYRLLLRQETKTCRVRIDASGKVVKLSLNTLDGCKCCTKLEPTQKEVRATSDGRAGREPS